MNYSERFRVKPGEKVRLDKIDAGFKDKNESHEQVRIIIVVSSFNFF